MISFSAEDLGVDDFSKLSPHFGGVLVVDGKIRGLLGIFDNIRVECPEEYLGVICTRLQIPIKEKASIYRKRGERYEVFATIER